MKAAIVSLGLLLTVSAGASSFCQHQAIAVARENTRNATVLAGVSSLPTKPYLESYRITFEDSARRPSLTETFKVIMMKSDCTVVSVVPELR